jgi:DNA polymerase-1
MEQAKPNDIFLIIDAHSLIHRAFHAIPPLTTPDGRPAGSLYGLSSMLLKLLKDGPLGNGRPTHIAAAFDRPEPTIRKQSMESYKATRKPAEPELISQIIEAHNLFDAFGITSFDMIGWEADDVVATLVTKCKKTHKGDVVVVTGDQDLFQLIEPGVFVVTPKTGLTNTAIYDAKAVREKFGVEPIQIPDYKGLVGDVSDNIKGVPGIGPKKAQTLLAQYPTVEAIYETIDEIGISDTRAQDKLVFYRKEALESKKLATLRCDLPIDTQIHHLAWHMDEYRKNKLTTYLDSLGFKSLVTRFDDIVK